jgi:Flp pilus assembly secretin CpaC
MGMNLLPSAVQKGLGVLFFLSVFLSVLGGCAPHTEEEKLRTFFERKPTEIESRLILNELSQVRENPHIANPIPDLYTNPPSRLKVGDGVKLFYFTKHHPSGDLSFSSKDKIKEKEVRGLGGTLTELGFKVSSNPSTNQLIVHCADDAECDRVMEFLERTDVPPIQVHIDCLILERFGDITMDWETTLLIENLFGEGVTIAAGKYPKPAFPGASLRESRRSDFGLDFGYWRNQGIFGHQVRQVVDILESRGYLKILLNPVLETVNGKSATVTIRDNAPIELQVTAKGASEQNRTITYSLTDYKWVADTLTVTPQVYADGSIGLKTSITIGSKSKPEGVVQTSIITERSVNVAENRIEPGKSLIIGGMRKSENRSVLRGVPGLKDIPVLGILFSSKDFEEKATEIIFILTPSISSGSIPYEQAAKMVRDKYKTPTYGPTVEEIVGDPTGSRVYAELMEKQAEEAKAGLVKARREAAEAERLALEQQALALRAQTDAIRYQEAMKQAQDRIQKAGLELDEARKQSQTEQTQIQQQKERINQLEQEINQARKQAEEAQRQSEETARQAQDADSKAHSLEQKAAEAEMKAQTLREQKDLLEKKRQQLEETLRRQKEQEQLQQQQEQQTSPLQEGASEEEHAGEQKSEPNNP